MMRQITTIFILILGCCQLFGQANFEQKDIERIAKNKVKIQTQWSYDYKDGKPVAKGYISAQTLFDKKGNIVEVINFKSDGTITSVITYTYDDKGKKTSYSRYKGNKEQLTYNQKYVYDPKGYKAIESGFDGSSAFYNSFTYDPKGSLLEIKYTTDKTVTEKRVFKYSGNVTEMNVLSPSNTILSKEITTYDNKKNILEEVKYIQNDVTQKYNYQYNPQGKKIEESKINFGNLAYLRKYSYDKGGNMIKIMEKTPEGQEYVAFEYKYDAKDNVTEERWTKSPTAEYSKKEHTYDANNLLTESECYFASYKFSVLYKYSYQYF
jgi:YD repeat-containing protein